MQTQSNRITKNGHHQTFDNETLQRAASMVQEQATKVAAQTEKAVRRYPLTSVGIALGAGAALGALSYRLLFAREPEAWYERLKLDETARRLRDLF